MALQSKSFLIYKGDTLENIAQFLEKEIGLNAFLIKTIKGVSFSENVTQITLLFEKYSSDILDSVAPREGAIFTSDIASDDFDLRFLFNDPVDYRSIQSGTFSIDGVGLPADRVYLDSNTNNYFLKVSASGAGFQNAAFHTYQVSTSLKRLDGSTFSYTPVGGYIFHSLSNAHIGDYTDPYITRRRGKISAAVIRLSKGINPQLGITEWLSQRQISDSNLISYTPVTTSTNTVDVYFLYISKLEPQIINGFPLNNSLLPEVSAPGKVTFVFNIPLDRAKLLSTDGLFSIEEGFTTSTDIPASKVTLLDDLQTVEIDVSTYFTGQKIYSILARPGILGLNGLVKEKPEQWTIHISAYEPGAGGTSGEVSQSEYDYLSGEFASHSGEPTLHYLQSEINISTGQITDLPDYTLKTQYNYLSGEYNSHAIGDNPHNITPGDIGAVTTVVFTGHTGETGYHYLQSEISITESQISDLGVYTTTNQFTGHTGETSIHFTEASISLPASQINSESSTLGLVLTADGEGGATWTEVTVTGGDGGVTQVQYNYLSGKHSALSGEVTGHISDTSIHFAETGISHLNIQDIGSNTHAQIDTHLSATNNPHSVTATQVGAPTLVAFTGHTGATNPHNITLTSLGGSSTTEYNYLSGEVNNHIIGDNPHNITLSSLGGASTSQYNYLSGEHFSLSGSYTGHTGDSSIHYLQEAIVITESQISDLGTYETVSNVSSINDILTGHTGTASTHFTEASIDHTNITNIGTNTHAQIDTHIGDADVHFNLTSIVITEDQISDLKTYALATDTVVIEEDITNVSGQTAAVAANISTLSGLFTGHTGDSSIHFTQAEISITESQISDLGLYSTSAELDYVSGEFNTHATNTSNPHSVTAAQVGSPTTAQFTGHTGNSSIHFTQAEISITESQISDLGLYATTTELDYVSGQGNTHATSTSNPHSVTAAQVGAPTLALFTGHSGDNTVHYTQAEISITESQISDLGTYATSSELDYVSGEGNSHATSTSNPHSVTAAQVGSPTLTVFTGHTGDASIHFTQADISVTASQIDAEASVLGYVLTSDGFGNASWSEVTVSGGDGGATQGQYNYLSGKHFALSGDFTGHTGDPTIHFTQAEISITESQISDLGIYETVTNVGLINSTLTGHTGDGTIHFTEGSISHTNIQDIGSNSHAVIDTHLGSTSNPHSVTAAQVGAPTTSQFTGHTGNTSYHYLQNEISITESQISDLGDYSTTGSLGYLSGEVSSHVTNTSNPHSVTASQVGAPTIAQFTGLSGTVTNHTSNAAIHFTESSIDHANITNIGTRSHTQIDNAITSGVTHHTNTSNPHSTTAAQVGAPTTAQFTGHTGLSSVHFTVGSISHTAITNIGTRTHPQIDNAVASGVTHHSSTSNPHSTTAAQVGAPTTAQFTGHTGLSSVHFTVGSINHASITNIGTNTHTQIDNSLASGLTHRNNTSNPHSTTADQVGAPTTAVFTGHTGATNIHFTQSQISITESQISNLGTYATTGQAGYISGQLLTHTNDASIHFTEASINHNNITNNGSKTHAQIDSSITSGETHFADSTIHYTVASINHTDIADIGINSHTAIDNHITSGVSHIVDTSIHFSLDSIDHTSIVNIGTHTHAQIDNDIASGIAHAANTSNPHSVTAAQVNALAIANNLDDVNNLDQTRQNLKVHYQIDDMLNITSLNGSDNHGVGNGYVFVLNTFNWLTGTEGAVGIITASNGNDASIGGAASLRCTNQTPYDLYVEDMYYFRTAINTTTDIFARFGLCQNVFASEGAVDEGVYFKFDSSGSANWIACSSASSTETAVDTNVPAVATVWKWWAIHAASSGIYFYDMDQVVVDETDAVAFISTNVPIRANGEMRVFVNCISNGATFRHMLIDKFAYPIYHNYLPTGLGSRL